VNAVHNVIRDHIPVPAIAMHGHIEGLSAPEDETAWKRERIRECNGRK
jgi:hypothetical protein